MRWGLWAALLMVSAVQVMAGEERDVLAITLLLEARGEGVLGMEAVANVLVNRSLLRGKSVRDVCLQPKQFSCWNDRELAWRKGKELLGTEVGQVAVRIADRVLHGEGARVVVGKATHYHNHTVLPRWARKMRVVCTIGNHTFYEES